MLNQILKKLDQCQQCAEQAYSLTQREPYQYVYKEQKNKQKHHNGNKLSACLVEKEINKVKLLEEFDTKMLAEINDVLKTRERDIPLSEIMILTEENQNLKLNLEYLSTKIKQKDILLNQITEKLSQCQQQRIKQISETALKQEAIQARYQATNMKYKTQITQLYRKIAQLQHANQNFIIKSQKQLNKQKQQSQNRQLQDRIKHLDEVHKLEDQLFSSKKKIDQLQEQVSAIKSISNQNEHLEQIEALKHTVDRLKDELRGTIVDNDVYKEKLKIAQQEMKKLAQADKQNQQKLVVLSCETQRLTKELHISEQRNKQIELELEQSKQQLKQLKQQCQSRKHQRNGVQTISMNCLKNNCGSAGQLRRLFSLDHVMQQLSVPSGQSYEGKNLQDQGGKVVHSYPQQYVNNIDETKLDGVEDYHPLLLKSQNSLPNPLNLQVYLIQSSKQTKTGQIKQSPASIKSPEPQIQSGAIAISSSVQNNPDTQFSHTNQQLVDKYRLLRKQYNKVTEYVLYLHNLNAKWRRVADQKDHLIRLNTFSKLHERFNAILLTRQKGNYLDNIQLTTQFNRVLMEAQNYMQFLDQLHKRETEKHHNIRLISRSRKIQVFEHCKSKFPTKFSKRRHAYPGQELVSSISKEKRSHSEGETVEIDQNLENIDMSPHDYEDPFYCNFQPQSQYIEFENLLFTQDPRDNQFSDLSSVKGQSQRSQFMNSHTEFMNFFVIKNQANRKGHHEEAQNDSQWHLKNITHRKVHNCEPPEDQQHLIHKSSKAVRKLYQKNRQKIKVIQKKFDQRQKQFTKLLKNILEWHRLTIIQLQKQFNDSMNMFIRKTNDPTSNKLVNSKRKVEQCQDSPKQIMQEYDLLLKKRVTSTSTPNQFRSKASILDKEKPDFKLELINQLKLRKDELKEMQSTMQKKNVQLQQSQKKLKIAIDKLQQQKLMTNKWKQSNQRLKKEFSQFMQKLKMKEQEKLIVFEASINSPKVMVRGRSDSESKIGDGWSKKKFPAFMDATISEQTQTEQTIFSEQQFCSQISLELNHLIKQSFFDQSFPEQTRNCSALLGQIQHIMQQIKEKHHTIQSQSNREYQKIEQSDSSQLYDTKQREIQTDSQTDSQVKNCCGQDAVCTNRLSKLLQSQQEVSLQDIENQQIRQLLTRRKYSNYSITPKGLTSLITDLYQQVKVKNQTIIELQQQIFEVTKQTSRTVVEEQIVEDSKAGMPVCQ